MSSIKSSHKSLDQEMLNKLYVRKCLQMERAKAYSNHLMFAIYKAEADLLKVEMGKL